MGGLTNVPCDCDCLGRLRRSARSPSILDNANTFRAAGAHPDDASEWCLSTSSTHLLKPSFFSHNAHLRRSSFFPHKHACLLQVMDALPLTLLCVDTLKLPQAVHKDKKKTLKKIADKLVRFFFSLRANGWPPRSPQPRPGPNRRSLRSPTFLPRTRHEGRLLMIIPQACLTSRQACTRLRLYPPHSPTSPPTTTYRSHPSFFSMLSTPLAPTWVMLSPSWNEVRKVMVRHIVQLRLSANGPSIIKGQAAADTTRCLCFPNENRWCFLSNYCIWLLMPQFIS